MAHRPQLGEWALFEEVDFDTTIVGQTRRIGPFTTLHLFLDVTAGEGTNETLDVVVSSVDPAGTKVAIATFTQATGVTAELKAVTGSAAHYIQATATIGGSATPKFTFTLYASVT